MKYSAGCEHGTRIKNSGSGGVVPTGRPLHRSPGGAARRTVYGAHRILGPDPCRGTMMSSHKVEQLKIDPYAAIAIWSGKKFSDLYCRDPGTG